MSKSGIFIRSSVLILTSLWFAFGSVAITFASTQDDYEAVVGDWNYYDEIDYTACTAADAGTGGSTNVPSATVAQREKSAFQFFVGKGASGTYKGLTPVQSAAIVGNLLTESAYTLDPKIVQGDGGPGRGIAQWTVTERWQTLLKFATDKKADPLTLGLQLDFLWHELNTTESAALKGLKAETAVAPATRTFMNLFERPNPNPEVNHIDRRIQNANRILRTYGNTVVDTTPSEDIPELAGDCSGGDGIPGGGVGAAGGLTFPLITTQKAITSHKPYPWCSKNQSNCHHDYNAADIMTKTGTVVIAAKAGKVTSIKGDQTAAHLTIKADGTGELYFYQHMGKNTLKVTGQQHVAAGQPLGLVGNKADAFGTDPHLHFDILPKNYTTRPSCKGPDCSSLPFINPQPALIPAFNALPKE